MVGNVKTRFSCLRGESKYGKNSQISFKLASMECLKYFGSTNTNASI